MDIPFVEQLPIGPPNGDVLTSAHTLVSALSRIHGESATARATLTDWYRAEHEIDRPSRELADPFDLDVDGFVAALRRARGRLRPLSPAGVAAVRQAWAETVAPVAARLREAEHLERRLSDLVDAAYGLTPDEVALMWATAPPRMPIPPPTGMHRLTARAAAAE